MKKETFKELGKGLISFANIVGGLSIVNGLFGVNQNVSSVYLAFVPIYSVAFLYLAGLVFINKGCD